MMKKRKTLIIGLLVLASTALLGVKAFYPATSPQDSVSLNDSAPLAENISGIERPEIERSKIEQENKITNIALFGIDTGREKFEAAHSDAIMILSLDTAHQKIKLTSLMRDTYVEIEDHGKNKLNAAYAFGGPKLAVQTINANFGLDIKDYAVVDFVGLSRITDALGGIEIEVKEKELSELNKYMAEVAEIKKEKASPLKKAGLQLLNGNQASAYARIRKGGEGDFDRAERQKNVLLALWERIEKASITKYPGLVTALFPYVKTSLSAGDIVSTGIEVLKQGITAIDWYRFPLYGYCQGETINSSWVLTTDLTLTKEQIHQFIYGDIKVPPLKSSF